jgi:chromosome segregation ATPase
LATEEEKKKKLEEAKRRLRDLRARIEKWAMLKISDVSEMNAVYREIGEVLRELAKLNPGDSEARREAEELYRRVEAELRRHREGVERVVEVLRRRNAPREAVDSVLRASQYIGGVDLYNYIIGVAVNYEIPLTPRDDVEIKRALGLA